MGQPSPPPSLSPSGELSNNTHPFARAESSITSCLRFRSPWHMSPCLLSLHSRPPESPPIPTGHRLTPSRLPGVHCLDVLLQSSQLFILQTRRCLLLASRPWTCSRQPWTVLPDCSRHTLPIEEMTGKQEFIIIIFLCVAFSQAPLCFLSSLPTPPKHTEEGVS